MRPRAAGVKHLTHEEKTQTACVLRLFGMPAAAVRQAAQAIAAEGMAVQCRSRGAETLLALQAETPAQLEKARKALQRQFAAQLYGEGETTLAAATVQALEAHKKLLVCADAAAGALLETRLETVAVAEKVFDFGAMSYADEKIRAKLDAKTRRVKGGPAAMALARVQAVLRLVGTDLAAGCVERAEDTVLFVGSRRGYWVRTVADTDTPALWLLDMLRRAACGLPQAAGTSWQKYGQPIPPEFLIAHGLPDVSEAAPAKPPRERHLLRRLLLLLLLLVLAGAAAAWYYTGGDLTALPQKLQSLGADSLPHSGAKLI